VVGPSGSGKNRSRSIRDATQMRTNRNMDIIVYIRNYRKSVEVRYINAETDELLYDMMFTLDTGKRLSDVIGGIEKMNSSHFGDNVRIRWEVTYDE